MNQKVPMVCLLALACSSEPGEKPVEADLPAEASSGGQMTESDWTAQAICPKQAPEPALPGAPPTASKVFTRADSFGNERWGADYYVTLSTHAEGQPGSRTMGATAEAGIGATLAGEQRKLASLVLKATAHDAEPARVTADMSIGQRHYPIFEFTAQFTTGDEITEQMFEVEYPVLIAGGVAEVSVEMEAWVTLGYQLAGQAHVFGISGRFEPHAAVAVSGGVSVGDTTQVLEAGLLGSLMLADVRAPLTAGFMLDPTQQDPELTWAVDCGLDLKWFRGNLTVYAELAKERRTKIIADWPGFESSRHLGFGSGGLVLQPPSDHCDATRPPSQSLSTQVTLPMASPLPSRLGPHRSRTFDELASALVSPGSVLERAETLSALKRVFRQQLISADQWHPYLHSSAAQPLLAALGADGSPHSLDSLVEVIGDANNAENVRMWAASALGRSPRITPQALQALQHVAAAPPRVDETITYAIANGANTLATRHPSLAETVVGQLVDRANSSASADEVVVLQALGNIRIQAARVALERFFATSPDPALRVLAGRLLAQP